VGGAQKESVLDLCRLPPWLLSGGGIVLKISHPLVSGAGMRDCPTDQAHLMLSGSENMHRAAKIQQIFRRGDGRQRVMAMMVQPASVDVKHNNARDAL